MDKTVQLSLAIPLDYQGDYYFKSVWGALGFEVLPGIAQLLSSLLLPTLELRPSTGEALAHYSGILQLDEFLTKVQVSGESQKGLSLRADLHCHHSN